MTKKKVGLSIDSKIHREGVKLAKKYGSNFSEMVELLVHEAIKKEENFLKLIQEEKEFMINERKESYNIIKIFDKNND